jgi:hypothetical protein
MNERRKERKEWGEGRRKRVKEGQKVKEGKEGNRKRGKKERGKRKENKREIMRIKFEGQ